MKRFVLATLSLAAIGVVTIVMAYSTWFLLEHRLAPQPTASADGPSPSSPGSCAASAAARQSSTRSLQCSSH